MGWLFYAPSRSALIRDRIAAYEDDHVKIETLKWACTGNNLWKVRQTTRKSDGDVVRFVALDLMAPSKHGWGYKDLDESVGPYHVNCPLSYLEGLSEPINDWAREWRENVRAHHAKQARHRAYIKGLKRGDAVTIGKRQYLVHAVKPGKVLLDHGTTWARPSAITAPKEG